jgi:SAM-dependent methyltransferase
MCALQNKIQARFRKLEWRTIRFLGGLSPRDAEVDFVYRHVVGQLGSILDVGACKSLLPLQLARQGHSVTVFDVQQYPERHPNLSVIQGDFLSNSLPNTSFDYVVMVSAIEHMGLGTYGASVCADGDFKAIAEAKRVLKPSGRIILTLPIADKEHHIVRFQGWYDLSRVQRLLEGMYVLAEEYYLPCTEMLGRIFKCLPVSLDQITTHDYVRNRFQCAACYVVSQVPRPNFR